MASRMSLFATPTAESKDELLLPSWIFLLARPSGLNSATCYLTCARLSYSRSSLRAKAASASCIATSLTVFASCLYGCGSTIILLSPLLLYKTSPPNRSILPFG